ncbi:Rhomboid family protein [Caulifigura coniformis]|uniref:Rhomboid family protein n=1 Tax=Caulifigura coniformis TaxID=2527983 RepID=A0A517S7F9_9PLAN|nr:rhomboid family intramembrane serine protease [Caulifigura coniformis]QDT52057.1 Rhomboid family protein [Caulifigura coniformis]
MFPLQDNIPSRTTPVCNYALIAICTAVFFLQTLEKKEDVSLVERYAMIPARITQPGKPVMITLDRDVVMTPEGLQVVETRKEAGPPAVPPWLTLATCTFLHGGWMHLLGNMWFLVIFGDNVEDRLGHVGYLVFYLVGGSIASLIHLVTDPSSTIPTVGASGAIAAVMGAYFVWYPHAKVRTFVPIFIFPIFFVVPATVFLGLWFLMQFLQGTSSLMSQEAGGVAWWAHIGGFGAGYLIAGRLGHSSICRPPNPVRRNYSVRAIEE